MNSYVTFNKESNQTVAVHYELLLAQILPGRVPQAIFNQYCAPA